ncbi:hypothetical protein [Flavisolibacter ginsenosidimutans]|uniref:Glycosyltransferase family 39 protein n=1 Tax=Flavisolibacter ginsenosidimutans TaxID=661481 RepID=A0A5B8UPQ8_9BACT|nr:hypothetical protein [Flavisolibacter ginsenosidimutans]QEC58352.1 hypothetical protein FSB75_21405 [Flavisolibacter ginsenosidimutans]
MEHLLFAAYLIFFAWLVTKTKFFTASGLNSPQLVIVFLLKVMAGILYGWIGVHYELLAQMGDTWGYHYNSLQEYHVLLTNPKIFFTDIFHNSYEDGYTRFLATENSWWNDLKGNIMTKLLALFDVFSFGNYYINVIFYSFISLFGPLAFYRVMKDVFPSRKLPILLAIFLVPSVLYWTSGLHKDGLVFFAFCWIVYQIYFGLKNRFTGRRILAIFLGLLLVLVMRNFLIIPLLPALFAWVLADRLRKKPLLVFCAVYALFVLLFFTAKFINPRLNFPEGVVERQEAFLKLGGGSAVAVNKLAPTFTSFLVNAPQAFALSTIRPYPSDVHHLLSLAASLEINFLLLLFLLFLWRHKKIKAFDSFLLFCVFFSFSVLMMIGYSVDVLGAIVRYRSIVLSFLIVPMVAQTDWDKIGRLFFLNGEKD